MSRIKWNLEILEQLKQKNKMEMDETESIIYKGREILSSMTEEVWEGEDGDMARDQLYDIFNKEMIETWRQLDDCKTSIRKAQDTAFEAKNFCNELYQIFQNGTIPADSDSSPCGGDVLCNLENGEILKAHMENAGKSAESLKSNIEMAESILAELETDEAKYDYASYTEPIKRQAQDVIDREKLFRVAVTRYDKKVEDMDRSFSSQMLQATPDIVPEPFDTACLQGYVFNHFKKSDIVDYVGNYETGDLGDSAGTLQIQDIFKMLFDRSDIDINSLSDEDIEIAFLKLSKEEQRAMLLGMGISRTEIDSIMASKEKRRDYFRQYFNSQARNSISDIDLKNPKNKYSITSDSVDSKSKSKSSGYSGAESSTGVVDCDSPSCAYPRLVEYDGPATRLNDAANALCDDDPSNDAQAIETMNECLDAGFYYEDKDGTKYLMYDTEYLEFCKEKAGEGSLLYGLLDDYEKFLKENSAEYGVVSAFDGYSWNPTYSLKVSQLRAGYQLTLNVDSQVFGSEIDNKRVAYAATNETAKNYLGSEGDWNWENIDEWLKEDVLDAESDEYTYFANGMMKMSDEEIGHIIEQGQISDASSINVFLGHNHIVPSDTLIVIAENYRLIAEMNRKLGEYQSSVGKDKIPDSMELIDINEAKLQEARALAFYQVLSFINNTGEFNWADFSVETRELTSGLEVDVYKVKLTSDAKTYQTIIAYPNGIDLDLVGHDIVEDATWSSIAPLVANLYGKAENTGFASHVADYVLGLIIGNGDPAGLYSEITSFVDEWTKAENAKAACQAHDIGEASRSMTLRGAAVYVEGVGVMVLNEEFDRKELAVRVAAYNSNNQTAISVDDLILAYYGNGEESNEKDCEVYNSYNAWFFTEEKDALKYYEEAVAYAVTSSGYNTSDISEEELLQVIEIVDEAIDRAGQDTISKSNYEDVCIKIKEKLGV